MEQSANSSGIEYGLERLAVKSLYTAELLQNVVRTAEELKRLQKKISRYIQQLKMILTWKRGCGALKMVGSATKTVGGVMIMVAPLHPKLGLAVKVGQKLWKLGTGLKVLTSIGHMLKDLWQVGCRNSIVEFIHATALLTQKLGVFGEVIRELQNCMQTSGCNDAFQTPEEVINIVRHFIPTNQLSYITHVINIAFGSSYYSPLFDFILMSSDLTNNSNIVQLMREIESFNFTEFVEQGSCQSLIVIGSFLHITRELLDFLDGFQKVTEEDCRFLSECLTRFTDESLNILQVASVLTNLDKIRKQQEQSSPPDVSMTESRDSLQGQENVRNICNSEGANTDCKKQS